MNKELALGLTQKASKKFPTLNLTPEDMCHITIITLASLMSFLREHAVFDRARLIDYAGNSVKRYLEEE